MTGSKGLIPKGILGFGLLGAALTGCAGYSVRPHPGENAEGLRFYRPEPYLLVTLKATENTTAKTTTLEPTVAVVWLPNYDEEYVITTWSFLSKAEFAFTLTDGWRLASISAKSDTTDALAKFLELVGKGTEAGAFYAKPVPPKVKNFAGQPQEMKDVVKLFRIRFVDGGVRLEEVPMRTGTDTPQ